MAVGLDKLKHKIFGGTMLSKTPKIPRANLSEFPEQAVFQLLAEFARCRRV
jgi:hypothetical protein